MDSREQPTAPFQVVPQQPPQQQPPSNMLLGPTSSYPANSVHSSMINAHGMAPTGGGGGGAVAVGFPFNSVGPRSQSQPLSSQVGDGGGGGGGSGGMNAAGGFDGSSPQSSGGMRFSIEPAKKKRGRPRKYTPDGSIALGLSPTPISSGTSVAHADSLGGGTPGVASEPPVKRNRGRPPGSGRKQLDALGGFGGVGFTPHVITVKAGEDVASKIMAFSQQGPRTVCILSANGAICNVTLRQPAMSGGTVTYEGRFEIISLSGSFLLSENNGSRSRTGGLSVSLAGSDGRVLGGGVAGMLMAASPVQVIVGSFVADKKLNSNALKSGASSAPQGQTLNFGTPWTTVSPPSQGASSESSDENGGSPLNCGPGIYGNAGQPMHNMQMYQLWAGQNPP